jgi:hypothetical protein
VTGLHRRAAPPHLRGCDEDAAYTAH